MKRQTVITAVVVIGVGFAAGSLVRQSAAPDDPVPSAQPSIRIPHLSYSNRVTAPGAGGPTRAPTPIIERARLGGARLHAGVATTCAEDQKCQYSGCSRDCGAWLPKEFRPEEVQGTSASQRVFIECVGYCLDPLEYAGRGSGDAK